MVVVALIPLVGGILVGIGGLLGLRGKLERSRGAGVRTVATLRSDEAFAVGNKVAGIPTVAAGAVGVFAGAAALFMPTTAGMIVVAVIGILGLLGLVTAGGLMGHRAAQAVPEPEAAGPCGTRDCCGGCAIAGTKTEAV